MVHYAGETPVPVLEEPSNDWEEDSVNGDEAAGEARGQEGPAQTATLEETMEALLRVESPDIPALHSIFRLGRKAFYVRDKRSS